MVKELKWTILRCFKSMDISIDKDELEGFMHVDEENNEEYSQAILGDVNEVLETIQTENDDTDDEAGPSNDCAPVETASFFMALNNFTTKCLKLRISCCVLPYKIKQEVLTIISKALLNAFGEN